MPLTKSFTELARTRVANDPDFAAALQREAGSTPPLTMRAALREIWKAASYPIRGNEDWRTAARMDAEALERAGQAVLAPGDPPEFAAWIAALRDPRIPDIEREDIMSAIYDLFDPERS
jgi:hypothetical protein